MTTVNFILYDLLMLCPEWSFRKLVLYGGTQKVLSLCYLWLLLPHEWPCWFLVHSALQCTTSCPVHIVWLFTIQYQASFSSFPTLLTLRRFCKESTGCSSQVGESCVWSFINLKISAWILGNYFILSKLRSYLSSLLWEMNSWTIL